MVLRFETTWYSDMSELRKQRNSSVKKCADLSAQLQRLNAELENKNQKLTTLKREFIVSERKIPDARNDILQANIKLHGIDETAIAFMKEFESKENELAELRHTKQVLETDTDDMRNNLQELSKELTVLEAENKQISQEAAQLLEEKHELSDEVSKYLSNTSLERDQVEEKFIELNSAFMGSMDEREAVKKRLENLKMTVQMLPDTVDKLKQQIAFLEEVKVVYSEMVSIRTETAKIDNKFLAADSNLKERQTELTGKKEQLDLLLSENADKKEGMISLEEVVGSYSEVLSAFIAGQGNLRSARDLCEQNAETLRNVLAEKIYLEGELQAFSDKIDLLEQIETELSF